MAEDVQANFQALLDRLTSEQEVVGAPPVVEQEVVPVVEEEGIGLSSLLGGAKEKVGDILQRLGKTFDPGIPEEAFPATIKKETEITEIPPEPIIDEQVGVIPSMMDIIYKKETGIYPDPFIRTMVKGTDMDAFGPAQIRRDLLIDLAGSNLSEDEERLRIKLIEQSKEFDKFNRGDTKDTRFGPGGKGFGLDDNEKRIYRSLAEKGLSIKAAQGKYDINNLSSEQARNLIGDWFSKTDPRRASYIQEAIKGVPIEILVGAGIIEPPPTKPIRKTGGMISRNPYPHNPRPI